MKRKKLFKRKKSAKQKLFDKLNDMENALARIEAKLEVGKQNPLRRQRHLDNLDKTLEIQAREAGT